MAIRLRQKGFGDFAIPEIEVGSVARNTTTALQAVHATCPGASLFSTRVSRWERWRESSNPPSRVEASPSQVAYGLEELRIPSGLDIMRFPGRIDGALNFLSASRMDERSSARPTTGRASNMIENNRRQWWLESLA